MKYTIVGDPHVTHKSIDSMTTICDRVEAVGNPVIWLGDQLDTKEILRGKCVNFWVDYFKRSKLQHVVLVGNHDYFNLECEDHALQFMKAFPNVKVIDKPEMIAPGMYALPYIHEKEELLKAIKPFEKGSVLFGHLELKDFDFGNGHICSNGVDLKSFSKFSKVISGHFHKRQEKKNLVYIGTPLTHSFGEANQEKFLGIFDSQTKELEFEKVDYLPMHKSVTIELDKKYDIKELLKTVTSQDLLRIDLVGTDEEINLFNQDLVLKDFPNAKMRKRVKRIETEIVQLDENLTNLAQFQFWAKNVMNLDEETINLATELIKELN